MTAERTSHSPTPMDSIPLGTTITSAPGAGLHPHIRSTYIRLWTRRAIPSRLYRRLSRMLTPVSSIDSEARVFPCEALFECCVSRICWVLTYFGLFLGLLGRGLGTLDCTNILHRMGCSIFNNPVDCNHELLFYSIYISLGL